MTTSNIVAEYIFMAFNEKAFSLFVSVVYKSSVDAAGLFLMIHACNTHRKFNVKYVMSGSFGFGGYNVSLVLKKYC